MKPQSLLTKHWFRAMGSGLVRHWLAATILVTVALLSIAATYAATPGAQLQSCANIMPLGDSITLGVNGGYRNNLCTGLQQDGYEVSYVGTQYDQYTQVVDKDHEGHPGFTIDNISKSVDGWISSTGPDIILLMIGTNDVAWWSAENGAQIGARHNALISQLQQDRPGVWIFVASIPPESSAIIQPNNVNRAELTREFNAVVQTNALARTAAGERVRFVDVNSVLTTADLYDGIHPTEAAHAKIAQKFLDAILAELNPPPTAPLTIAITGKKKITTVNPAVLIKGQTTGAATSVTYRVGAKGAFKKAAGSTSAWKFRVKLKPDKNVITVITKAANGATATAKVIIIKKYKDTHDYKIPPMVSSKH